MSSRIQHHISWETASGQFIFRTLNGFGSLTTSDGQVIELPLQDWTGIAEAVQYLGIPKDQKQPKRHDLPENAGAPWDTEQEQRLIAQFQRSKSISTLAREFARTPGAIKARLQKLGLVD